MGEPSKEAQDEARAIVMEHARSTAGIVTAGVQLHRNIAAAIQKHMDATAHAKASWDRAAVLSLQIENELRLATERAEKAEALADQWNQKLNSIVERCNSLVLDANDRAEAAEHRLAELLREMREWSDYWRDMRVLGNEPYSAIVDTIAKYAKPTEVAK
jgi:hypothetical protein